MMNVMNVLLLLLGIYPSFDEWLRPRWNRFRSRRTRRWPRAQAVIEKVEVCRVDTESGGLAGWDPRIQYGYEVSGIRYAGRAQGEIWPYHERWAALETADSLTGQRIPVRYNPHCPAKSVYIPSDGAPPQLLFADPDPKTGLILLSLK